MVKRFVLISGDDYMYNDHPKKLIPLWIMIMFVLLFGYLMFMFGMTYQRQSTPYSFYPWMSELEELQKQVPDRISEDQIVVGKSGVEIRGNYTLSRYKNTNSMLPIMDMGSNGIYIPANTTTILLGDIITFRRPNHNGTVVHRVVEIGLDENGVYYITKGDNVIKRDALKLRKSDISKVMVGVIW